MNRIVLKTFFHDFGIYLGDTGWTSGPNKNYMLISFLKCCLKLYFQVMLTVKFDFLFGFLGGGDFKVFLIVMFSSFDCESAEQLVACCYFFFFFFFLFERFILGSL